MKKIIVIEILLLFALSIELYFFGTYWNQVNLYIQYDYTNSEGFYVCIKYSILFTVLVITTIAAITLIALKDFKPLANRLQARKEKRNQAKAERAIANKQAKIENLEKQLEELKKDE